jgi:hypothetical protein
MNKPTFYEQVGIVIPGAVFLFGVLQFFPSLRAFLGGDGVSLGELGIFFLLSYAAGHLVAAVGNLAETIGWRLAGGMPTDWVVKADTSLLSPHQRELLDKKVKQHLGMDIATVRGMERKVWWPISRQLYVKVLHRGKPDRIDTFNGNYGLNRGLSAACLLLAVLAAYEGTWRVGFALLIPAVVYGYRAYRFGVHYGRELFVQFLALED